MTTIPTRLALMVIVAMSVSGCVASSQPTTVAPEPTITLSGSTRTTVTTQTTVVTVTVPENTTTNTNTTIATPSVITGLSAPDAALISDSRLGLDADLRPAYATSGEIHVVGGWAESGSVIEVHSPDGVTVHTTAELLSLDEGYVEVRAIEHWNGLFWAFVQGDTGTGPGVASVLVSADAHAWERRDVGANGTGARLPGGFATPDVPQFEGASGVTSAASVRDGRLVAAGWTRTDAGVQPVLWATTDGSTWATDVLPNKSQPTEMATRIAASDDTTLVHTIGGFYFGQDLLMLSEGGERDVSLVGEQMVIDVVASGDRFVLTSSAFGSPPTAMWEWSDGAWHSIAPPEWQPLRSEIVPFQVHASARGAVVFGSFDVGIRADGSWAHMASFGDPIVSATVEEDLLWVLTSRGSDATFTAVPLP